MSKKCLTEEQLVVALKCHDLKAVAYIYKHYSDTIYGTLLSILKDPELSSDAFQEVVFKIWNAADRYDASKGRLFTWMINIARNYAVDRLRSRQLKNHGKNNRLDDCFHEIDHSHQVNYNIDVIGIRNLVFRLKPELQIAIDLVYFKGYNHVEAAEFLELPLGTFKTRVRTAMMTLRRYYLYEQQGAKTD